MDDIRDLKELQLDALSEVENIGAGHAATALSQMTNRRIMITVPQITVTRLEDVAGLLGDPPQVVAAVLLHMLGDLTGRTLLVFPERGGVAAVRPAAQPPHGHHDRVRRPGAVEPQGGGQHPVRRLHERAVVVHGDDAAAVGADASRWTCRRRC